MSSLEDNTDVFIVRIWRESREIEGTVPEWRGVVEHVPSGERRYFRGLDDMSAFIASCLDGMGVKPGSRRQVGNWLKWLRACIGRTLSGRP